MTPWTAAHQVTRSIINSQSLLKLMSIESVMAFNHLILYLLLLLLPSILSSIRVFSNESALCIRWPRYWSSSFSISPSMNIQYWFPLGFPLGLISFRIDWLDLLAVQGTLKSLFQDHRSKAQFQSLGFYILRHFLRLYFLLLILLCWVCCLIYD